MAYIDHITDEINNETIDIFSQALANEIAEKFNTTRSYQAGDYVFYEGYLYRSTINQSAGSFSPSRWQRKKVVDMVWDIARRVANG